MKRVPRSASLRASKQFEAKEPSPGLATVQFNGARIFLAKVGQIRHAGLHLKRHLILGDAGSDFRIINPLGLQCIEAVDGFDNVLLSTARKAWRIAQVQHGFAFAANLDPLMLAGQETATPLTRGNGLW